MGPIELLAASEASRLESHWRATFRNLRLKTSAHLGSPLT